MSYVCVICVYTYFTGIAPCMGLRGSFVLFLLSKHYIDYVYTFDYTGCIKKTEQILNRSQRREAAQSMKFFINIDCLGTYDVE